MTKLVFQSFFILNVIDPPKSADTPYRKSVVFLSEVMYSRF